MVVPRPTAVEHLRRMSTFSNSFVNGDDDDSNPDGECVHCHELTFHSWGPN